MKSEIAKLAENAKITLVTTHYFFEHKTKLEKRNGLAGNPCKQAQLFLQACKLTDIKAEYISLREDGTTVRVSEDGRN